MASKGLIKNVSRRTFLKYAGIGGLAAFGAFSALKYPSGWTKWLSFGQKPWEIAPGVVDYSLVAQFEGPMNTDGVPQAYIDNPDMRILNVAQWYDYWPGYVIRNFTDYMNKKFNLPACEARWTSNIYTSNEELFTWVTQTGRKFDVMVPTNYTVETMEKAGLLVNLKQDWIPNYLNIFGRVPSAPTTPFYPTTYTDPGTGLPATIDYPGFAAGDPYNNAASVDFRDPILNGYAYRGNTTTYATQKPHPGGGAWSDSNGIPTLDGLVAIPYQWGTTGIGYRQDVFRQQDIEAYGWDVLGLSSYTNPDSGITYDLTKKRMMLDDMREVFTAALKEVGFADQERLGAEEVSLPGSHPEWRNPAPPPVIFPPTTEVHKLDSPYNKLYQWSNNEVAETKLQDSADWLNGITGTMWGFNTPQQGPWLVSGTMLVDHAWSGDIMYAVRPNLEPHPPVDYFVPKQGGARWIDNLTIHRECEKLWLSHQFINYIHEPEIQATISSFNLYATPNAWTFQILYRDPSFSSPTWNPAADHRIYSDIALGTYGVPTGSYTGQPILNRCEYQKDVGVQNSLLYFQYWRGVKF